MEFNKWPAQLQTALEIWRWQYPDTIFAQWEERAAIMEFDGGMSRGEAEFQAAMLIQVELNFELWGNHKTKEN